MEQQSFPCYNCGQPNLIGQPFCGYCGQPLNYNCPNCGAYVNNTFIECPQCHTPLYWPARQSAPAPTPPPPPNDYQPYYNGDNGQYDYTEEPATGGRGKLNLPAIISLCVLGVLIITGGILYATDNIPAFLTSKSEVETADNNSGTTSNDNSGTTSLKISNPKAGSIQYNSATITWTTNEPSTSQVEYGTSTDYGSMSSLDTEMTTSHSVVISGLNPQTTYFFRVLSEDDSDNLVTSSNSSFTTVETPQTDLPVISAISANVTATAATIRWTTDKQTTGQVDYGTTSSYGNQTFVTATYVTSHIITISGLTANTTYHYRVRSKDASGNEAVSSGQQFKTSIEDSDAPNLSGYNVAVSDNTSSTTWELTVTWITDEEASSEVLYGTDSTDLDQTSGEEDTATGVLAHSVTVDIDPDETYYYRVVSVDEAGNEGTSGIMQLYVPPT